MSARTATPFRVNPLRIGAGLCLAASGYLHAELYVHGYRAIPWIGPMFLLQASGALAVGLLLFLAGPGLLRLGAVALSAGALAGFTLSRTIGVLGFVERGFDPAPQALLSVLAEVAALVLLAGPSLRRALTSGGSHGASRDSHTRHSHTRHSHTRHALTRRCTDMVMPAAGRPTARHHPIRQVAAGSTLLKRALPSAGQQPGGHDPAGSPP